MISLFFLQNVVSLSLPVQQTAHQVYVHIFICKQSKATMILEVFVHFALDMHV